MDFRNKLVKAIQEIGNEKVLKALGYSQPDEKQITRLENVTTSAVLGLDDSFFDFKYSNSDYIKKLSEICGLNIENAEDYIRETKNDLTRKAHSFKPYIYIETGFKRTTQPIFALAALEHTRYIRLPIDINEEPALTQLSIVHQVIDEHYQETKGFIGIWGYVISYFFVYDKGCALEISPTGKIIKNYYDYHPGSVAKIEHKGKELKFG